MSSNGPYTGEFIRYLFARKTLACARHRAAVAEKLDLNETDTRAIVCIAHDGEVTQAVLAERLGQTPATAIASDPRVGPVPRSMAASHS
jgi:DNA-binding MarR family transcriptional regulator